MFFEDKEINPFMAAGASHGMNIDDFNGDNFDHSGLGFFGGAWISAGRSNGRPIATRPVPPGTPRWGREWKKATAKWYNHSFGIGASACNYAHRENYLDLDPTYKDALGRPLIRMTYNFHDNDYKVAQYLGGVIDKIATAMKPTIKGNVNVRRGNYNVVPYQSTHNTGGTIMGADPKTSAVNRYGQAWEADNLFVMGASLFPQNASLQPDRPARRARLLDRGGDHQAVYQEAGRAGAGIRGGKIGGYFSMGCAGRRMSHDRRLGTGARPPTPSTAKRCFRAAPPATASARTRLVPICGASSTARRPRLRIFAIPTP